MKRRFAAILFLIFFGLFLAGCDGMTLPSGVTLPTTTSATEAPTSGGETTAIPTTAVPTSGGETTAVPTTTVPTSEGETTAIPTTAVPTSGGETTAVPTTAVPTTAVPTTAVPTTAVPTTAVPTTAVPTTAPVTTEPVTTETPTSNDYTTVTEPETVHVLFFDDQGTLLHETDVIYDGTAIYGGAAPTKVEDDDYSYTFVGWSLPLENLRHDTSVVAVFQATYKHGTGTFDTETLYDMLRGFDPESEQTPEQLEEQAHMMMTMFGVYDEEHLYTLLNELLPLVMAIHEVTTPVEFNTWYLNLKTAGVNGEMIVDGAIRLLMMMADEMVEQADPSWMIEQYDANLNLLALNQTELAGFQNRLEDYCQNHTQVPSDAFAYFNALIEANNKLQLYHYAENEFYEAYGDEYEITEEYNYLHQLKNNYYNYLYEQNDPDQATNLLNQYLSEMDSLSTEQQNIFIPLFGLYDDFRLMIHVTLPLLEATLEGQMDFGTPASPQSVAWVIREVYVSDYQNLLNDIDNYQREIQWMSDTIPEQLRHFEFVNNLKNYLVSSEGIIQVKEALVAIYETADAMILGFDPDLYNLVMEIIQFYHEPEEPEDPGVMMIEEPEPTFLETLSAAEIAGYIQDIAGMMVLADTTMNETRKGHITDLIKDVLEIYLETQDVPALAITGILAKVDEYITHVDFAFGEVIDFLQAVDEVKVQSALDFITVMKDPYTNISEIDMIIMAAGLADTLLGDGAFDINGIVERMISVYYDVSTNFDPDAALVLQIQTAVVGNITGILEQCEILNGKDAFSLGPDGMMALEELMARMQAFQWMFEEGLETILEPIEMGFDHDKLVEYVGDMFGYGLTEPEVESMILDLMEIFGQETESDLYYLLFGGFMHVQALRSIDSFTDLKAWVDGIQTLGLSNTEMAQVAVRLIRYQLTMMLADGGEFDQREDSCLERIDELGIEKAQAEQTIVNLNATVLEATQAYGEHETLLNNYWNAYKLLFDRESEYEALRYSRSLEDVDLSALTDLLELKYYIVYYNDPEDVTAYQNIYDSLTSDLQTLFNPIITAYQLYLEQEIAYNDLDDQIVLIPELNPIYWDIYEWEEQYQYLRHSIEAYDQYISEEEDYLTRIAKEEAKAEQWLVYVNTPIKATLIESVILVALDEVNHLLVSLDPLVMDELAGLVFNRYYGLPTIMMVDEPDFEITPEMAQSILDQLSTALGSIFETMDETDDLNVTTLLKDFLEIELISEGVTDPDLATMLTKYGNAIDRYYPEIETILGLFSDAVAGVDLTEITTILNYLPEMSDDNPNQNVMMIYLSDFIRILTDKGTFETAEAAGTLDYPYLINLAVELMIDVQNDFEPLADPLVLTQAQTNIVSHVEDILAKAFAIAAYDPSALPEDGMAKIYELQKYGEYFMNQLGAVGPVNIPYPFMDEGVPMEFGYQHEDFVEILWDRYRYLITDDQVEDLILELTQVYETTEENTFFLFIMTSDTFGWGKDIYNISEYLEWSESLSSFGLLKADMVHYLFGYLGMLQAGEVADLWQWDQISYYQDWISGYENDIAGYEIDLAEFNQILSEIPTNLTNPVLRADLLALIEPGKTMIEARIAFENARYSIEYPEEYSDFFVINDQFKEYEIFDEYELLSFLRFGSYDAFPVEAPNEEDFNLFYGFLDPQSHALYDPILDLEAQYVAAYNIFQPEYERILNALYEEGLSEFSHADDFYFTLEEWGNTQQSINNVVRSIEETEMYIAALEREMVGPMAALEMYRDLVALAKLESAFMTVDDRVWTFVNNLPKDDRYDILWEIDNDIRNMIYLYDYYDIEYIDPVDVAMKINNIMMLASPVLVDYALDGSDINLVLDQYVEIIAELSLPDDGLLEEWVLSVEGVLYGFIDQCVDIDAIADCENMTEAEMLVVMEFITETYPNFLEMFSYLLD